MPWARLQSWASKSRRRAYSTILFNVVVLGAVLCQGTPLGALARDALPRRRRRRRPVDDVNEEIPVAQIVEVDEPRERKPRSEENRTVSLGADGCERLVAALRAQRRRGSADVVVRGGGKNFYAHRAVLEASSPALGGLARRACAQKSRRADGAHDGGPSDEADASALVIDLGSAVRGETLRLVLDFAYGAVVQLTESNVEALLELSSRLQMSALVDECCAFVAQRTSARRACHVLAVADRHKCTLLRRDVLLCTLRHFGEAAGFEARARCVALERGAVKGGELCAAPCGASDSDSDDACGSPSPADAARGFVALPLHILREVLADDGLDAPNEAVVFLAACRWLEAELDEGRARHADAVLSLVRYALIDAEFLADHVEAHAFTQSPACQALVHAAYRIQALPPTRAAPLLRPRHRGLVVHAAAPATVFSPEPQEPPPPPAVDNPFLSPPSPPLPAHLQQRAVAAEPVFV
ncbi:hypothetical protein M885DRAFT_585004 [Pelagophyceae sp. CCMP2097]|nr:hypothetical protein M885DRAFT_585004 [Pelagophyceae sp. CCMP2097]